MYNTSLFLILEHLFLLLFFCSFIFSYYTSCELKHLASAYFYDYYYSH